MQSQQHKPDLLKMMDYFGPLFTPSDVSLHAEDNSLMNHPASCCGPSAALVSVPLFVWFLFCVFIFFFAQVLLGLFLSHISLVFLLDDSAISASSSLVVFSPLVPVWYWPKATRLLPDDHRRMMDLHLEVKYSFTDFFQVLTFTLYGLTELHSRPLSSGKRDVSLSSLLHVTWAPEQREIHHTPVCC